MPTLPGRVELDGVEPLEREQSLGDGASRPVGEIVAMVGPHPAFDMVDHCSGPFEQGLLS
jgi:hypothetical protein